MIPGQHRFQGKEKTFSIAPKTSRHGFARFRRKPLANLCSLEMIDITMHIFPAIHVHKTVTFDWAIFG